MGSFSSHLLFDALALILTYSCLTLVTTWNNTIIIRSRFNNRKFNLEIQLLKLHLKLTAALCI